MSDLVGNPEDRFSHNEAHLRKFTSYESHLPQQEYTVTLSEHGMYSPDSETISFEMAYVYSLK